ncbi:Os03g0130550, partial [Oryza sativa Japonica Group]
YLGSWNSSSGRAIQRRLHYVGRELTPALRHGDEAQRVEELRPAEEAGLVLGGVVGTNLGEDLLRQVGALEEGDGLLAADAAVLVQIRAAEVGLEGLHPSHRRDLGRSPRRADLRRRAA